jgi:hypothetical protein
MARATDAHAQADPEGAPPIGEAGEAGEARRVAVARDPGIADAGEIGGIPVAANAAQVVQTRDPYHGVRDRGQCGPAARAVRRCRASPNY